MTIKEAIDVVEDMISSFQFYEKDKPEYVEALRSLRDLAERYEKIAGVMPEKRTYQNTREWFNGGFHFAKGYNQAIEDCTLVMTKKLEGLEDVKKKYNELIMSVSNKYKGETRHDTALRYIKQVENSKEEAKAIRDMITGGGE